MITVDANIYISALEFGGIPMRLLHKAVDGEIEIAISQSILNEVLRILRDKFGRSEKRLSEVEEWIASFTTMVVPMQRLDVVKDDRDDNVIVECAVASGSDVIVTGDKDLLRMREYEKIKTLTPGDFIRRRIEQ